MSSYIFPSVKQGTAKHSLFEIASGQYYGLCHNRVAFPSMTAISVPQSRFHNNWPALACLQKYWPRFELDLSYHKGDRRVIVDNSIKRFTIEQIIGKLREADILLSTWHTVEKISRKNGSWARNDYNKRT